MSFAGLRNQCTGSMFPRMSIASDLSRCADEEATSPARSVPRRCFSVHRRAARMLRVSTIGARGTKGRLERGDKQGGNHGKQDTNPRDNLGQPRGA